jgi:hypothetical protein
MYVRQHKVAEAIAAKGAAEMELVALKSKALALQDEVTMLRESKKAEAHVDLPAEEVLHYI